MLRVPGCDMWRRRRRRSSQKEEVAIFRQSSSYVAHVGNSRYRFVMIQETESTQHYVPHPAHATVSPSCIVNRPTNEQTLHLNQVCSAIKCFEFLDAICEGGGWGGRHKKRGGNLRLRVRQSSSYVAHVGNSSLKVCHDIWQIAPNPTEWVHIHNTYVLQFNIDITITRADRSGGNVYKEFRGIIP